ncbi:uncharacterized protein [Gossypium hirsutum]|uniref:Retrotransposon gag domain-containing protein n=1 Tax=Gossypium hirsutum TaxID=3635 RepID=A0ABM2YN19_GOSHI|nr:uncharacterized protein LOC121205073 [Gossypium hirsutum]
MEETESATPSVNLLDNQLLRDIADALQHIVRTISVTTSVPAVRQAPIKELRKYGATEFQGLKGVDPSAAENWMETTKRVFQQLDCTLRESLICVVSLLQGEAYLWWESVVRHLPDDQVTWELFQKEFQKKYIGELYIEEKRKEFLVLKQGNMSVLDYEREFSRLSKYASEYVPTEAHSCKRFLRGLRDEIKIQLELPVLIHYQRDSENQEVVGDQAFGLIGVTEAEKNRLLSLPSSTPATSQRSVSTARGRGISRGGSVSRRGVGRSSDIATQQSEARAPARAYVVRTWEEGNAHDVVTTEHGVILDCYKKKFSVQTEDGDSVEVNGIRTSGLTRIISAIKVNKLLHQGCIAYLAYVINSDSVESQCSQIRIVCEFPGVFLEELLGLPPDREVEFAIEVYPSTDPISIPSYRKANVVADALSRKAAIELRAMFAQLSISDDGGLSADFCSDFFPFLACDIENLGDSRAAGVNGGMKSGGEDLWRRWGAGGTLTGPKTMS